LVVFGRSDSQAHLAPTDPHSRRQQVALARRRAIRRDPVDLALDIPASYEPFAVSTRRVATNDDRVPDLGCPFALNPQQLIANAEQEVRWSTLTNWSVDIDRQRGCGSGDVQFRNVPFLI
jgi:hypothetical protein